MKLKEAIKIIDSVFDPRSLITSMDHILIINNRIAYRNIGCILDLTIDIDFKTTKIVDFRLFKTLFTNKDAIVFYDENKNVFSNGGLSVPVIDVKDDDESSYEYLNGEYLEATTMKDLPVLTLPIDNILSMYDFSGNDEMRPAMNGVIVRDALYGGTDSHILLFKPTPSNDFEKDILDFTIPRELNKFFKVIRHKTIDMAIHNKMPGRQLIFKQKDIQLFIFDVLCGTPAIENVIPKGYLFESVFDSKKLKNYIAEIIAAKSFLKMYFGFNLMDLQNVIIGAEDPDTNLKYNRTINVSSQFNKCVKSILKLHADTVKASPFEQAQYKYHFLKTIGSHGFALDKGEELPIYLNIRKDEIDLKDVKNYLYYKREDKLEVTPFSSQKDIDTLLLNIEDIEDINTIDEEFYIGMDPKSLMKILNKCNGALNIKFIDNNSAMVFNDEILLMPMMLC